MRLTPLGRSEQPAVRVTVRRVREQLDVRGYALLDQVEREVTASV